jgi:hypothetical protein
LNRHPKRALPALVETTPLEQIYVRVEHQIFYRLPRTQGLLFGIRLSLHPLNEIMMNPKAADGLRQAIETMPKEIAEYKGIYRIRERWLTVGKVWF